MPASLGFYRPAEPLLLPRVRGDRSSFDRPSNRFKGVEVLSSYLSEFLIFPFFSHRPTEDLRVSRQVFLRKRSRIPFHESSIRIFLPFFIAVLPWINVSRVCNRYLYIALIDMHIACINSNLDNGE